MARHVPAVSSTAMAGEALQDWNRLDEKLSSKLLQLTSLLHHFSAFPPESPEDNEEEIAGQHESEIHEILNETASRIRQFKTSLEYEILDNRLQETIEVMSSQYDELKKESEIELNTSKSETQAAHKAEVERLKLESFIELEKWSQDSASREAEWHAQEKEMREKLQSADEENRALVRPLLTTELDFGVDFSGAAMNHSLSLQKENLKKAMGEKDSLSTAFEALKNEAENAEKAHSSGILEWESTANHLRTELQNMTNACETNQNMIENFKAKNEESSKKMEKIHEARMQAQTEAYARNVQELESSFLLQMEELRKGSEIQLGSMEEILLRQKEEKARVKEACAKYIRDVEIVNSKLEDQESKFLSQFHTFENKIVEMEEKLGATESKGSALEEDFKSLVKRSKEHTHHSKQVARELQEARSSYSALEKKMTALAQEYGDRTMRHTKEIELLKEKLREGDCAHKLATAAASQAHELAVKQCLNDMQRLEAGHTRALAELVREHQMEIDELSTTIQAKKDEEMAEQRSKLESFLRRSKMECSEEVQLMTLEHERVVQELKDAADKKEAMLVRAHMNALKTQQEESEEGMARCKTASAEALKASEAVSQRLARDLYTAKEDHIMQIREMDERFQIQLLSMEEEWKNRLETLAEQLERRREDDQATSQRHFQSDLDDLRNSLLTSFTEEKLKLEAERRKEAHALQARISELENLRNHKDQKIRELMQEITNTKESSRATLLELKACHKKTISEMKEKQRAEMKEIRLEGTAMIEKLQRKHRTELQDSQSVVENVHLQAKEVKQQMEEKLEKLQSVVVADGPKIGWQQRFDNRESRKEDVVRIKKLQETCVQKETTIQQLHSEFIIL
ncbi:hypothetical protein R1sor_012816 [Riccia sorocarpa]|uniref:Uncharacterized protein n=1 Tax=Riccia sorocarpa TaxID=122646 RepID=A0ABD3I8F0_9MARC